MGRAFKPNSLILQAVRYSRGREPYHNQGMSNCDRSISILYTHSRTCHKSLSWGRLAVGCREKIEKFVHNACLLNYYCYLYGKLRKKLRMLRHGASQGNLKGLPCCHFIKLPSTRNGLTSPLSYIHTSFIAFGDCLCRAMICLRIKTPVFAVFYALRKLLQIREFLRLYLSINKELY